MISVAADRPAAILADAFADPPAPAFGFGPGRGLLVTVEGLWGAGKSTAAAAL